METLVEMARKGSHPEWLKEVERYEGVELSKILRLIADGKVVVPRNILKDDSFRPRAIGKMMSTKINANVGTSADYVNLEEELEKARVAQKYGADAIMDLSSGGDLDYIRKRMMEVVEVPFGTVPIYQLAREKSIYDADEDDFFRVVEKHAKDGVDFMTIHAGVNRVTVERLEKSDRLLGVVSRGGSLTIAWMKHNDAENPYYRDFDYLLEILREYDVTVSLGDAFRPGCIHDASDRVKFTEFIILGELVEECRKAGVQAMVEGPGHVPIDEIETSVKAMKYATNEAPLYLLGPLVTDIAAGYDHIAGAIGAAIAGMHGADFICYVTPAEHLALPTVEDVIEGLIASKIAAHAIDLVKEGQRERARKVDYEMSLARKRLDWETQFRLSVNPERAMEIHARRESKGETCSMCGDLCAIKTINEVFEGRAK
ncbi:thiamine biosynthesis protein (thiC) [Geoglobus ahangari]|uniref:Phosphomethylpyrimidine synthase n=1 Tax=Geoglobus ahangari TaxID=113653 RepID=A0A0F7IHG3_9EURY|nr:phosphomethylpyrimidine synthase [Geoglobus ahangari]AKG91469.1 thiamine biosynthesis protein (thiC) [Geoglobus ahangari]